MFKELSLQGAADLLVQPDAILSVNGVPVYGMVLSLWEHSSLISLVALLSVFSSAFLKMQKL